MNGNTEYIGDTEAPFCSDPRRTLPRKCVQNAVLFFPPMCGTSINTKTNIHFQTPRCAIFYFFRTKDRREHTLEPTRWLISFRDAAWPGAVWARSMASRAVHSNASVSPRVRVRVGLALMCRCSLKFHSQAHVYAYACIYVGPSALEFDFFLPLFWLYRELNKWASPRSSRQALMTT